MTYDERLMAKVEQILTMLRRLSRAVSPHARRRPLPRVRFQGRREKR